MPIIYLSPSTQEWNPVAGGGNEEYYMNLIADAMEPFLRSSGIRYRRNTPDMTAASSIVQSNQGNYDLHLALHSNAAPESEAGMRQGTEVYYAPGSKKGRRAAEIIAENLRDIYPYPQLVRSLPTTRLGEVTKTRAPAVLVEFAYHDNLEDANWIRQNIPVIAQNVVLSLTQYFGIPFIPAQPAYRGVVQVSSGWLNIRQYPNTSSAVLARAWNGNPITVTGNWQGWYVVDYYGTVGYADARYIVLRER
ncbi:MAG: SH3 domain-containing protein [Anaerotruncus sp.]|nr:SH3 domain-containing protein [Anaerotruncus sp.]